MKKVIMVLLIAVMGTMGIMADDFRGLEWGASRGDVLVEEGVDYYSHDNLPGRTTILYERQILDGVNSDIAFILKSGALSMGAMMFPTSVENRVVDALTMKYGDEVDLSSISELGFKPNMMHGWSTDSTYIVAYNDGSRFFVLYQNRELYDTPDTSDDAAAF